MRMLLGAAVALAAAVAPPPASGARFAFTQSLLDELRDAGLPAALAFIEADANGDGVLEWHEFKDAVKKLRSMDGTAIDPTLKDEESLRALFDSIDLDKGGTISMDEYFLWCALLLLCSELVSLAEPLP